MSPVTLSITTVLRQVFVNTSNKPFSNLNKYLLFLLDEFTRALQQVSF